MSFRNIERGKAAFPVFSPNRVRWNSSGSKKINSRTRWLTTVNRKMLVYQSPSLIIGPNLGVSRFFSFIIYLRTFRLFSKQFYNGQLIQERNFWDFLRRHFVDAIDGLRRSFSSKSQIDLIIRKNVEHKDKNICIFPTLISKFRTIYIGLN